MQDRASPTDEALAKAHAVAAVFPDAVVIGSALVQLLDRVRTPFNVNQAAQAAALAAWGDEGFMQRGVAETVRLRDVLAGVRSEIVAGFSLSVGLDRFPAAFPTLYRASVAAGEQSGELPQVMLQLADHLEQASTLRRKTQQALIYPALVATEVFFRCHQHLALRIQAQCFGTVLLKG